MSQKNTWKLVCGIVILGILGTVPMAFATTDACRCVAFRIDDVQDFFLNNAQKEIIDLFQQKNASLTVGIIGNYLGDDTGLVNFLKEGLQKNPNNLEFANHGWNHEDFTTFAKKEQSELINNANEKIWKLFGVSPSGFIPPFNKINTDTISALQENNIRYVSANVTQDVPSLDLKNDLLYHLPATSFTGDLNSNNTSWYGTTHKETLVKIHSSLINYGFAVVTLHPQEYSKRIGLEFKNEVDVVQIHELEMLIGDIKKEGLDIVTISEIPKSDNHKLQSPVWIKQIFVWYENKMISAEETINAINFLTANKIINFNA